MINACVDRMDEQNLHTESIQKAHTNHTSNHQSIIYKNKLAIDKTDGMMLLGNCSIV
jgi:hypothetical protein